MQMYVYQYNYDWVYQPLLYWFINTCVGVGVGGGAGNGEGNNYDDGNMLILRYRWWRDEGDVDVVILLHLQNMQWSMQVMLGFSSISWYMLICDGLECSIRLMALAAVVGMDTWPIIIWVQWLYCKGHVSIVILLIPTYRVFNVYFLYLYPIAVILLLYVLGTRVNIVIL